jgi:long-chain fatty acid transport protein
VAANIAYSHFTLKDVYMATYIEAIPTPEPEDDYLLAITPVQVTDDVTGWGYGATVGMLYRATRQFSAGLTFRSPMTMAYKGTFGLMASGGGEVYEEQHKLDFEMTFPMWAGVGFAYRDLLFDGLTLTGDVHWTNWSTFEDIDRNIAWAPSSELPEEVQNELDITDLKWDDTIEVAAGFDYRLGRSLSVGLGYRNSPSPAPDNTYDFIMPQSAKNVIGMGVTYRQDFWRASFTLEYQAGEERRIGQTADMNGKHVDDLLIPSLSFTYAF